MNIKSCARVKLHSYEVCEFNPGLFLGDLRSWAYLEKFAEQTQNTFREPRKLFSGILGDQCIIFRDQGSADPSRGGGGTLRYVRFNSKYPKNLTDN